MFGIGLPEMIVILAVALIVVGPDKLPELARSLAKGINELKNTMNQVKESLSEETKVVSSVQRDIQQTAGQMKTHLLKDVTGNPDQWKQEGDAVAVAAASASDSAEEDELIEEVTQANSSAPRYREEDAASVQQEDKGTTEQSGAVEADVEPAPEHHEAEGDDKNSAPRPSSVV